MDQTRAAVLIVPKQDKKGDRERERVREIERNTLLLLSK